ncbi:MAG TPA: hypothetical protein VMT62_06750 [Syntrophorhabdaceae bacterium]|nr:hypothetical protein [Syntrophorhabdaceae bacterium]
MKLYASLVVFFLVACASGSTSPAQVARVAAQGIATEPATTASEKTAGASGRQGQHALIHVRTKYRVDFSGTVTQVDPESHIISISAHGKTITFDMTSPTLAGYNSIRDIKKGDAISVAYTSSGIEIRKGSYSSARTEAGAPMEEKPAPREHKIATAEPAKPRNHIVPARFKDKPRPTNFQDLDNNKDGKLSPVELCVMYPDLTMEKFRQYDRNCDGYLDESEYRAMKRSRP